MNNGRTIFSQLIEYLPNKEFQKCVRRYRGDHYVKKFSCWDQFLSMAFAQLTYRDGLRDIESCLQSVGSKLYHMGFRSKIKKSTLADANELRDWRIYADFAQILIAIARPLYALGRRGGLSRQQRITVRIRIRTAVLRRDSQRPSNTRARGADTPASIVFSRDSRRRRTQP